MNTKKIRSTQRKMLRFIIQTQRQYTKNCEEKQRRKKTRNDEDPTNDEKAKKKIPAKTLKEKQKKVTAQTQIATKTAKSHALAAESDRSESSGIRSGSRCLCPCRTQGVGSALCFATCHISESSRVGTTSGETSWRILQRRRGSHREGCKRH